MLALALGDASCGSGMQWLYRKRSTPPSWRLTFRPGINSPFAQHLTHSHLLCKNVFPLYDKRIQHTTKRKERIHRSEELWILRIAIFYKAASP